MKKLEKKVYSVREVQEILGVGRNKAYELCSGKEFPVIKAGNTILIPKESFEKWLTGKAVVKMVELPLNKSSSELKVNMLEKEAIALRMITDGILALKKIAEYTDLPLSKIENMVQNSYKKVNDSECNLL